MAKKKTNKELNEFLKMIKQNTKAIIIQLKELKKTDRSKPEHEKVLNHAASLYEVGGTIVTAYRDRPKILAAVKEAQKKTASKKKNKKK